MSLLLLVLAAVLKVHTQTTVIVEDSDPRLLWSNAFSWIAESNPQDLGSGTVVANYWHGGTARAIFTPGATVTLMFNGEHPAGPLHPMSHDTNDRTGSRIAWYGDQNWDYGRVEVSLGGHITVVDTIHAEGAVPQVKLFEALCDGRIPDHSITLTTLERRGVTLDYFEYLVFGFCGLIAVCGSRFTSADPALALPPSSSQLISSTDPPEQTGTPLPLPSPSAHETAIAATSAMAGIGWMLFFVTLCLQLRSRRRRAPEWDTGSISPTTTAPIRELTTPAPGVATDEPNTRISMFQMPTASAATESGDRAKGATRTTAPIVAPSLPPSYSAYRG